MKTSLSLSHKLRNFGVHLKILKYFNDYSNGMEFKLTFWTDFLCAGNSCRSPMAEAIFQNQIRWMGLTDLWEVESAAILGYHVGKNPEPRATSTLRKAGITDYSHIARKVRVTILDSFLCLFIGFTWLLDQNIFHNERYRYRIIRGNFRSRPRISTHSTGYLEWTSIL